VYGTHGQLWTMVVPKADVLPDLFTADEARAAVADGGARLPWAGHDADRAELVLAAVGAYQLGEVLAASRRLAERDVPHAVTYIFEPGRFRRPRRAAEHAHQASPDVRAALFPERAAARVLVTHTRPEPMLGLLEPLHAPAQSTVLGYVSEGGTYDTPGLLFVDGSSWAHVVAAAARLLGIPRERVLEPAEREALDGRRTPQGVLFPEAGDA
jgi:phosphoketolase